MEWNSFLAAVHDRFPPAPAHELHALEHELGCTLPADYLDFLQACNGGFCGGRLWYNDRLPDGRPADVDVNCLYGLRAATSLSLREARAVYHSPGEVRIPLDLLPIGDDSCGNAICLAVRGEHHGKVFFWDHEAEPDPATWDGSLDTAANIVLLAESFAAFVAGLLPFELDQPTEPPLDPVECIRRVWNRLCDQLGLRGDVDGVWGQLRDEYCQPWRAYHNLQHIQDCVLSCSSCCEVVPDTRVAELALWFHDAVYVVGAADNEDRSAQLAQAALARLRGSRPLRERVARLIRATDHRNPPPTVEAALVCDVDLEVLGRGIDIYDRYAAAIQAEVGLPEHEYAPHRRRFLQGMLAKPWIFHTERFRRQYEDAARTNLQRELETWEARAQ